MSINWKKNVDSDYIADLLYEFDTSGDEGWIELLIDLNVSKHKKWVLKDFSAKSLPYSFNDDTWDVAEEYSEMDFKTIPPIVMVKNKGEWEIVDGNHRAAAAAILKKKIKAYVPAEQA